MIKISEEELDNGQIMEVFQDGDTIIKTPKPSDNVPLTVDPEPDKLDLLGKMVAKIYLAQQGVL